MSPPWPTTSRARAAGAADFGKFLVWATLGNILGGVFFVALIKFGHIRAGKP